MNGTLSRLRRFLTRRSVKTQGRFLIVAGFVPAVLLPFAVAAFFEWRLLRHQVTVRGQVVVDALVAGATQPLLNYDVIRLDDLLESIRTSPDTYRDVSYAMVLDSEGRVLSHTRGYGDYGQIHTDETARKSQEHEGGLLVQEVGTRWVIGADSLDLSRAVVVGGKRWGTVRVGIDLGGVREALILVWSTTLAIAFLLASLVAILIGQLFRPMFLVPVEVLRDAADALERRNFGHRIAHDRGDEFGEVYDAVNRASVMLGDREKLYATFGRYVTDQVRDAILSGAVSSTGKKTRAAVVFADLRGFTARSESLPAEEVLELLNRFCSRMTTAIHAHGGIVDKFIGDSVMAVFGVPFADPEASVKAVLAVEAMRRQLDELNTELAGAGAEPLRMGVGIHSGDCVAGCVGPPTRQQYTVVGDTVNLAARMQDMTKQYGVDVLVSEQVYKECGNFLLVRDLGKTAVEGRQTEVHVYQLLGTKHDRGQSNDAIEREKERERKSAS